MTLGRTLFVGRVFGPFGQPLGKGMIATFSDLVNDTNPVHLSDEHARSMGFEAAIAHGAIGSSIVFRMLVHELHGWPTAGDEVTLKYVAPIFHGDSIVARGICDFEDAGSYHLDLWCDVVGDRRVITAEANLAKLGRGPVDG